MPPTGRGHHEQSAICFVPLFKIPDNALITAHPKEDTTQKQTPATCASAVSLGASYISARRRTYNNNNKNDAPKLRCPSFLQEWGIHPPKAPKNIVHNKQPGNRMYVHVKRTARHWREKCRTESAHWWSP